MNTSDISKELQDKVITASNKKTPLSIQGGATKSFYGRQTSAEILDTRDHQGIINYEPTELVITAHAGTKLSVIEQTLADNNQMLSFEPPAFGDAATIGGTIACNLSGPRRAYCGAARDYVLGTRLLNGKGEILSFGGEVMKNVAGYDVSRLVTGALGTLGVILDVSLKILPRPEAEITLAHQCTITEAFKKLNHWARSPLPISASCFTDAGMHIRLSGTEGTIKATKKIIGGDEINNSDHFWHSIKEQQHSFFNNDRNLWRLSVASNSKELSLNGKYLYEWAGALRWLLSDEPADKIYKMASSLGGHAILFRNQTANDNTFQPLPEALMKLHKNLKQSFDPYGILNPGRMYKDF
ncbi:MAG: glycolate oxidase subunit GlcE [Gammaproteobacteria bacterium]|nr:glycolate oxidase subunit GlcE [Gammaproteobacteria bacterium]MCW8909711.1 glycolate oxidase subunit GlcE [Gammaproteobacteria bacterium]MCW9004722.1 glycolate oxidase subunit GlcE [Gammaproteobacteria bacterium]MCW9056534.1 glycolate oxidase subunit GlcE [Gammaproteobacteria bacterium]